MAEQPAMETESTPGRGPSERRERMSLVRWTVYPVLTGLVLGTVWAAAAPGGLFYGSGSDYQSWAERDLLFAGLGLLAGAVIAVVLSATRRRAGLPNRGLAALAGSVLGTFAAWGTGVGLTRVLGSRGVSPSVPETVFGLQALSSLAVWPGVVALTVLALTTLWWVPPREGPED
ncbi:hypothetical protein [Sinomonas cellulolyticus]|uniref:Uncharacterized protein n=1 Tax=Sinomonas cellulolyticus TaxID=2801916 RepID=A0ABS1K1P9_9MICC|nr:MULTISPECIES: hypothetical protein [Sinomonas]MBL0705489.1 hypothetical protein [Sinomonas cellulolyticus]